MNRIPLLKTSVAANMIVAALLTHLHNFCDLIENGTVKISFPNISHEQKRHHLVRELINVVVIDVSL